jgi:hypothetical protein
VPFGPGREAEEAHGDPDDAPVLLGDVGEHAWHVGEQVCTQPFGGRLHGVRLTLVVGRWSEQSAHPSGVERTFGRVGLSATQIGRRDGDGAGVALRR